MAQRVRIDVSTKKGDEVGRGERWEISSFILSQILAGVSFGFGLSSFQFKGRRKVLLCLVACNFFNASHFFLLGRPGPAALLVVTGLRYSAASFTTDRRVMGFFLVVTAGAFFVSATNALGLLACIGTLIAAYGSFEKDDRRLRLILMVANAMWTVHNILALTPVGAIMEGAFPTSNIVGYRRHHVKASPSESDLRHL